MNSSPSLMAKRQAPLVASYTQNPQKAITTDFASSRCAQPQIDDPLKGAVTAGNHTIPIAVHSAVGGESDGPVPGDILCAALASCMDSTIRIIANHLGLELLALEVQVSAVVDVRGTLCVDPNVPVGFQKMHISTVLNAVEGSSERAIDLLHQRAEYCCVILQTLKSAVEITTQFQTNIPSTKSNAEGGQHE
ncbi:MAG: OsmC family protein [Pseudomonadales bacterium]|nr:OsmC family protein [Pseudomonadales bacterium]